MIILDFNKINKEEWNRLIATSSTATWFQTAEAYEFFAALPELFKPFVYAIDNAQCTMQEGNNRASCIVNPQPNNLRAVCVGYVTVEKNPVKQMLTRRAIIIGGPALADDCTDEEVSELMEGVRCTMHGEAIYIETRNFNDYSKWKGAFKKAGFEYVPHLNFHVHTNQTWEDIEANIGKHRKKYIRLSYRDGAGVVESPTIVQVKDYYELLKKLYTTKVKTPLQPWEFFERLYNLPSCHYILVEYQGNIVGGSICMTLVNHGVYEWYACGSDGLHKNIYPSSVTKHAGMKYTQENGYPIFDMMGAGKSGVPYGVRDFKAEFGGELVEHGRYQCICNKLMYSIGVIGVKILKRMA